MLDARFSQLYSGPSLNTLQRVLPAIAGLLVFLTTHYAHNVNHNNHQSDPVKCLPAMSVWPLGGLCLCLYPLALLNKLTPLNKTVAQVLQDFCSVCDVVRYYS